MSMLDSAMSETWDEIANQGSGVDVGDVVRVPAEPAPERPARRERREDAPRERRGQSRTAVETDRERDERGRFVSQPLPDDAEPESFESVLVDEPEAAPPPRRRPRGVDPDEDDDEADELDEDELDEDEYEEDDRPRSGRVGDADEVEGDDDALAPEGDRDDDDEDDRPSTRQREARRPRFGKKVERYIDRQVESRISKALDENAKLREAEAARSQTDAETARFFGSVLGTDEHLGQLEAVALDTRRQQYERDAAAQALAGYRRNRQFAEQYRAGLQRVIQIQEAQAVKAIVDKVAQFKPLDQQVLGSGDRAKIMAHCIDHGIKLASARYEPEVRRLKKQLANLRGVEDDHRVSRGVRDRPSLASANGRRANGRVPQRDPLRGAMERTRGIAPGSSLDTLSDDLIERVRKNEISLADIGLGRVEVG